MSEYQQYGTNRLEQKCIAPGHWVIEGHDVERNDWGSWVIRYSGHRISTMGSLRVCREFLVDHDCENTCPHTETTED